MQDNKEKIKAFLLSSIQSNNLQDDDDIFARGFVNSMFAMELVLFVEKTFGLSVEDQDLDLENFKSINAIAGFIERKGNPDAN